jgi:4-amino-4-deoxy-L-arabinose transferase-like glycosyltransferase
MVLLSALYFSSYQSVPFHPDETTHIFMSGDFQLLLRDPLSMSWSPGNKDSNQVFLRSLGAPLTKYILGITLTASGLDAPDEDWDWSLSWNENVRAGAFPESKVLNVSRLTTTIMTLLALIFLYYCVKNIWDKPTAVTSILLMGLNPLTLLHGRRAMNEAAAILGISFFLWLLTQRWNTPLFTGISSAISFNAKQILLLLLPVGIIAVSWTKQAKNKPVIMVRKAITLLGVFLIITFFLNPYFWSRPFESTQHSLTTIKNLQTNQLDDFYQGRNQETLQNLPYRVIALTGNLYFSPLSFSDVGNYDLMITDQVQRYNQITYHTLLRNQILSSILITISLAGFVLSIIQLPARKISAKKSSILLILTSILLFSGVLILQPVPWQRYVVTLVPITSIWAAVGLQPFTSRIIQHNLD